MKNRKNAVFGKLGRMALLGLSISPLAVCASDAQAKTPSQIYTLGDSSADVGTDGERYSNLGNMWIETVSSRMGFQSTPARFITPAGDGSIDISTAPITNNGGTNYAVGGATAVPYTGLVNFADQMNFFRQDHSSIDKDALVFLWMGSNDPAQAETLGIPYDPELYATTYIDTVLQLQNMGAKNIVAMSEPVNLLPNQLYLDIGAPQALIDIHKENVRLSNEALWPKLKAANVYLVDVNKLGDDILSNINKYGFTVGTEGYMTLGDPRALPNDGHIFANNHYSSAMHNVIADYTIAQLRARDQYAHILTSTMDKLQQRTASHRDQAFHFDQRPVGKWISFAGTDSHQSNKDSTGGADVDLDSFYQEGYVGGDVLIDKGVLVGGIVSYNQGQNDFGDDTGNFKNKTLSGTAYVSTKLTDKLTTNVSLSYGQTDYSRIKRKAPLGNTATETATGNTDGSEYAASTTTRYDIPLEGWTVSPSVSATYSHAAINGYQEKDGVLALAYGDSHMNSVTGAVGLAVEKQNCEGSICPYGSVSVEHEFLQDKIKTITGPNADMLVSYETDRPSDTTGHLTIGATYPINDQTHINVHLSGRQNFGGANIQDSRDLSIGASMDYKF